MYNNFPLKIVRLEQEEKGGKKIMEEDTDWGQSARCCINTMCAVPMTISFNSQRYTALHLVLFWFLINLDCLIFEMLFVLVISSFDDICYFTGFLSLRFKTLSDLGDIHLAMPYFITKIGAVI